MSAPPTLVLSAEDERTIVDRRSPAERPVSSRDDARVRQPTQRLWSLLRNRWRWSLTAFLASALCVSSLAVTVHQRRVSEHLRESLEVLRRARLHRVSSETIIANPAADRQATLFAHSTPEIAGMEPIDREELELEGATLVITNDYGGALAYYRRLSAQSPDEQVFSHLVAILGTKHRCQAKREAGATRCD